MLSYIMLIEKNSEIVYSKDCINLSDRGKNDVETHLCCPEEGVIQWQSTKEETIVGALG